ncbi:hypothetical protein EON64_05320 [archaeon]|nr:MAG: hypothetical protein EON64_05320 [archaeon]
MSSTLYVPDPCAYFVGPGRSGNGCHIDCSNRGVCDHKTGTCQCFPGSWGAACDKISGAGSTYQEQVLVNGRTILVSGN